MEFRSLCDLLNDSLHEHSRVTFFFLYHDGLIEAHKNNDRPYFLLFSAQWCHWCHEFGKHTLSDHRVAEYLNHHFINVFIDADIHNAAYLKYRATGLPYTVFLNPDATPHFRYSGTLYADDFLTVIKQTQLNVSQGLSVENHDDESYRYEPPAEINKARLQDLATQFRNGLLDNFDPREQGLGQGEKALFPQSFLYLLDTPETEDAKAAATALDATLSQAVRRMYDPVEGGFFRYTETRDWQVPHYEKMADLNAGIVLLLQRLELASASDRLTQAADHTLHYLQTTLYDPSLGAFLSFQEADTRYYTLKNKQDRAEARFPPPVKKIFIDRLASTLDYLIALLEHRPDTELARQVGESVAFVVSAIQQTGSVQRFYSLESGQWSGQGTLHDYVLLARMLTTAGQYFDQPRLLDMARELIAHAISTYHDERLGIVIDPAIGNPEDAEFWMEINGRLAQCIIALNDRQHYPLLHRIIAYFSAMDEVLEERLWEANDWAFVERYVPYLKAVEAYFSHPTLATTGPSP